MDRRIKGNGRYTALWVSPTKCTDLGALQLFLFSPSSLASACNEGLHAEGGYTFVNVRTDAGTPGLSWIEFVYPSMQLLIYKSKMQRRPSSLACIKSIWACETSSHSRTGLLHIPDSIVLPHPRATQSLASLPDEELRLDRTACASC